jgi:hypothetical protein
MNQVVKKRRCRTKERYLEHIKRYADGSARSKVVTRSGGDPRTELTMKGRRLV